VDLDTTRIFVKVIEAGSFSAAAQLLRLPKSTVSRSVSRLEAEAGAKLLLRTTRSLKLTELGREFFERSRAAVHTLEEARKALDGKDAVISGLVRITAPEDLGNSVLASALAEISRKHPALRLEFLYSDRIIDLQRDGFDLAVRLGKLADSSLKAKRLGTVKMILVASPKYLRDVASISKPEDLGDHSCLTHAGTHKKEWILRGRKSTLKIPIEPKLAGNQMTSLIRMALNGAGIALVPKNLCAKDLQSGKLERVLKEFEGPEYPVTLVSPLATSSIARVKVVADEIVRSVTNTLLESE
jgi:LysR family transcriptional regulator, regulator for bpeEF and oprC